MYRIPYAAENLVTFDQDDAAGGLCFSKDFHDAGYSGYIREEDGLCQAFQVESYGSLTMSTEDHLKKVRRARRLAIPQDPSSTNSLASGSTTSPAFSSPQSYGSPQEGTSVGINFGHDAAVERLIQHHGAHIRDEGFKSVSETNKVQLAMKCAYCQLAFGNDPTFRELQGTHKQKSVANQH